VLGEASRDGDDVVVRIEGLEKSLGDRRVLDGVDLEVRAGETLILLGGSGAGKSTLLRCILGLERPDAGRVLVRGVDVHRAEGEELRHLRERIGVAFQGGALFGSRSVADNIDLVLREYTRLPPSTRSIVARIKLSLVGLGGAESRYPSQLSGGMRKRAALARALTLDPELLFCDEPSAGLDPVTAAGIDQLLLRLKEVFAVTMVVVTHDLQSAFTLGDRLALLHEGRVQALGPVAELRRSADPVVRRFLHREADETDTALSEFAELSGDGERGRAAARQVRADA
jgi:phospholipid/cholesterol/gamma-HCH transport system ATP-binding protein